MQFVSVLTHDGGLFSIKGSYTIFMDCTGVFPGGARGPSGEWMPGYLLLLSTASSLHITPHRVTALYGSRHAQNRGYSQGCLASAG